MKQVNFNYFWVGLFVLAMGALLMATLFEISGNYRDTEPYYVRYTELTDVHVGTQVTYGGYQIGRVSAITPLRRQGKTIYKVQMSIQKGWKIPSNSIARISIPRLLSESSIDIIEGDSKTNLAPGNELQGEEAVTATGMLRDLNHDLKPLIHNLNHSVRVIGGDLEQEIPRISKRVNALLDRYNESAERLSQVLSDKNRSHLAHVFKNADAISTNLKDVSAGFNNLNHQLNQLLSNSNELLVKNNADIRQAVVALRSSLETVSQNINAIVYNLDSATRNLNEFSRKIRQNPGALIRSNPPEDKAISSP